jgi:hypothetical protein
MPIYSQKCFPVFFRHFVSFLAQIRTFLLFAFYPILSFLSRFRNIPKCPFPTAKTLYPQPFPEFVSAFFGGRAAPAPSFLQLERNRK